MNSDLITTFQQHGVALLFKIGFLIILVLFFAFLTVVLKQIRSMNTIVTQPDLFPYLQSFALGLIIITVTLFIVAVVIL